MKKKNIKFITKIESRNLLLREIKLTDVNRRYLKWMNDYQTVRFIESRFNKWTIKKIREYVKKVKNDPSYLFLAILLKKNGRHIGNIKLGPINKIHQSADIGIIIGEKAYQKKGYALEAVKLLANFSFESLRIHKLSAGTYSNNRGAIGLFKKAGFSIEGTKREQCFYEGHFVDIILFGMVSKVKLQKGAK